MKKITSGRLDTSRLFLTFMVLIIVLAASSCATNGFMGFGDPMTTVSYIENAMAEKEAETQRIAGELTDIQGEVAELANLKNEINNVLSEMEKTRKDTAALQNLADQVGDRLEEMPIQMLRQLVQAIETYLETVGK